MNTRVWKDYFVDGWVNKFSVCHIPHDSGQDKQVAIVSASVRHSQRLQATPLKAWVAAEMQGNKQTQPGDQWPMPPEPCLA